MKNLIYVIKYLTIALIIGIVTTLFWTCTDEMFKEKLQQICEGESQPVIIKFRAMSESICGTKDSLGTPQNALIEFSFSTPTRSNIDTFIYLDTDGYSEFEIYDGCTGVDLLWIKANNGENYLSWTRDSFGVLCCQENLIDSIYFPCSNSEPTALNCDILNDTIKIDFNMQGKITTLTNDIPVFEQAIISGDTVSIDFTKLEEFLGNNPQIKVNFRPNLDQPIFEVSNGNPMVLQFSLDNSQIIEITNEKIELPTVCINEPDKKGTILIIINAVVEEISCNCPYEGNSRSFKLPEANTAEPVPVRDSQEYNDLIIPWNTLGLDTSCTIVIESVVRESGDAQDHPEYWSDLLLTPTANSTFKNKDIKVSNVFSPLTPGISKTTYTVTMYVESATGTIEGPCSFTVECEGEGCENYCPSIRVLNTGAKLDDGTNPPSNIAIGTLFDFDSGFTILRNMKRTVTTDCFQDLGTNEIISFNIEYDNEYACASLNLSHAISGDYPSDVKVNYTTTNPILNGILPQPIIVTYDPPLSRTEGVYYYTLTLTATDGAGFSCTQVIQITGNVESITSQLSARYTISAFSQIAEQVTTASHAAYKIDEFDEKDNNYGRSKSGISNYVETDSYDYPGSEADYTFYFDVDTPKNPDSNGDEKPKLYLVDNDFNNFDYITQYPVAYLAGHDDLDSLCSKNGNYELIQHIFSGNFKTYVPQGINITNQQQHTFDHIDSPLMWNNEIFKSDFVHPNGVALENFGVYILWNANEAPTIFGQNKVYCHLALLYVQNIRTGEDIPDINGASGIADATFYIEYPLEIP